MSVNYLDWRQESSKGRFSSEKSRCPLGNQSEDQVAGLGREFFQPFLEARPGIPVYRHSQIEADPRRIVRTPYYRNCMTPFEWRHSAHLLLWKGGAVETAFAFRRRGDQGDFTDGELETLRALQPHLQVAFGRIRAFEEECQRHRLLQRFYRGRPGGVIWLDWELRPLYRSHDAVRILAELQHGRSRARRYTPHAAFSLPPEILGACEALRDGRTDGADARSIRFHDHGIEALVTLRPEKRDPLTKPVFEIRLDGEAERADTPAGNLLHLLTPGERELAGLVCRGLSNKEIAATLCRTEGTIKVQLSGIFRKLRVDSRTRLVLALR